MVFLSKVPSGSMFLNNYHLSDRGLYLRYNDMVLKVSQNNEFCENVFLDKSPCLQHLLPQIESSKSKVRMAKE